MLLPGYSLLPSRKDEGNQLTSKIMVTNRAKRNGSQGKLIAASDRFKPTKSKLEDEIDALFQLPLSDFTNERNALASRLKKDGRANEAGAVKALSKPSVSAWVVNQIYWNHRDEFDELIASGQRVRKFQTTGFAGKVPEMRAAMDARGGALTRLSDIAATLLSDVGSSPTPDMLRRVTTTLEALSSFASLDDGPTLGRLTQDVDPPGFESLTSFSFGSAASRRVPEKPSKNLETSTPKSSKATVDAQKQRKLEETRQAMLAAAKVSLQSARKLLVEAQARAKKLEADEKKVLSESKEAEKRRRDAEAQLKKFTAVAQDLAERAQSVADDAEEAANAVEEAKKKVEKVTRELEVLLAM